MGTTSRHHMKILLIFFVCFISATLGYFGDPSGRTLDIGDYKTCVVLNDAQGSVKCFGMAADGQLGTGSQKNVGLTPNTTPLKLPPIQLGGKALYVSSGYKHTCVLMETQNIRCFGLGHSGRLGYGSEVSLANDPSTVPAAVGDVPLGVKVQQVACGTASTCVIHSGGKVRCWGLGFRGILGDGKTNTIGGKPNLLPRDQPDVDLGGLQAVDIATSAHACVIVALATQPGLQHGVGQLYCWGSNGEGQLGYGHTDSLGGTPETVPIKNGPVPVGAMVRQVDVGLYHTCVVTETHTLRCWGSNQYGQLGYGKAGNLGNQPDTTPAQVGDVPMGGKKVLRVATGAWHTCVLLDDHTVKCWGRGSTGSGPAGPIGYGDDEYMIEFGYIPVTPAQLRPIALGGKAALIRSGRGHTCAIMLEAGAAEDDEDAHTRMKCWGWGAFGALGYGERESVGQVPKKLPKDMNVVPVEPIKPDPWLVADATTELELRPFGGHGASLPFEKPPHRAASFLLWTLPPLALLVVCCDVVLYMRKGNSFSSYLRRGQSRGSGKFD